MSAEFMNAVRRLTGPMQRSIRMMISRAIITLVNDDKPIQEMQVSLLAMPQPDGGMGKEMADGVEVIRHYGFTSQPHPGAEAVYVSVAGIRSHGLIIATEDRRYRLSGLAEGEVALYDDLGQMVHLTRGGIVIKGAGLPIMIQDTSELTVKAATKVRMETPLFEVTGDIIDNCDGAGRSMAGMRQIHDEHGHPVPNVQPGLATIETSPPTQQE